MSGRLIRVNNSVSLILITSSDTIPAFQNFKISYDPDTSFTYRYNNTTYTLRSLDQVYQLALADARMLLLGDFDVKQVTIEFNEGFIETFRRW